MCSHVDLAARVVQSRPFTGSCGIPPNCNQETTSTRRRRYYRSPCWQQFNNGPNFRHILFIREPSTQASVHNSELPRNIEQLSNSNAYRRTTSEGGQAYPQRDSCPGTGYSDLL